MNHKYINIFQSLLSDIKDGVYPSGTSLPVEHDLMKRYSVSRDTIRKSLALLENQGYITKQQGKGSIVVDSRRFDFPVSGVVSFKELADTLDCDITTRVVFLEKIKAPKRVAELMHLKTDALVWKLERVRSFDGEAAILDIDFIDCETVAELPQSECEVSLYQYIEDKLGLKIAFADKKIFCCAPSEEDLEYLDLDGFDMVVRVDSITYLDDGRPYQVTSAHHRPDKFTFKDFARRVHL